MNSISHKWISCSFYYPRTYELCPALKPTVSLYESGISVLSVLSLLYSSHLQSSEKNTRIIVFCVRLVVTIACILYFFVLEGE